ncbi:TetR/AcrR family transcriptional regulator [Pararhodospirillum oryzae]|uniref:TetR family transcriptional regulator n=1 Tax=Pararhodospirillum oryzae TaxID=478448 RepID=A0A512H8V2_9PROT|nr:TetR/AcrR family transcriptional regulator [Pararhodospirillum oryzae]GEO81875.1 TetR family transcriptional regulator [Pararhodospirillum oryzae]
MTRLDTRARLIDAALRIVRRYGAAGLTLQATADEAGVSKGGLLYHFRSKDQLIGAMVEHLVDGFEEKLEAAYAAEESGPSRWARAYVRVCLADDAPDSDPVAHAFLAAAVLNPAMLAPMRDRRQQLLERLRGDAPDPERVTLIFLALDGLFLRRLSLGITASSSDQVHVRETALTLLGAPVVPGAQRTPTLALRPESARLA